MCACVGGVCACVCVLCVCVLLCVSCVCVSCGDVCVVWCVWVCRVEQVRTNLKGASDGQGTTEGHNEASATQSPFKHSTGTDGGHDVSVGQLEREMEQEPSGQ